MVEFFRAGGEFMYVILAVSIVALAVIVEKFYALTMYYQYDEDFFQGILNLVRMNENSRAFQICRQTDHPLAALIAHVLAHEGQDRDVIKDVAEIAFQKLVPLIQKRTSYVNMFANVATLLGLLGTIQGLIMSFTSLSAASGVAKAEVLSRGISTAMNTTAFGLVVAIPCVIAYTMLTSAENAILQHYEAAINELVHCLSREEHKESSYSIAVGQDAP